jgi:quinol monooxygenase YgiN
MLIVLGCVQARSDTFEEALRLAREHVERSRQEPGCLAHAVHVDLDEPTRLVFIERWTDWKALGTHVQLLASAGFAKAMGKLGARAPEMTVYKAITSQPPAMG